MKRNAIREEFDVIGSVEFYPSVSVIMPFDPKMIVKAELQHNLKMVLVNTERELRRNYSSDKVDSVLSRLNDLITNLDYLTHKKSIAIYVSPMFQKIYYLDIPVEQKIVIDGSFEIRDLVYSKKAQQKFLVLVLSSDSSKIYQGNSSELLKIVSNLPATALEYDKDSPQRVANFSDPKYRKQVLARKFLKHVDESLSILLEAYPLPLFVMGAVKTISAFRSVSKNLHQVVDYIHGNFTNSSEPAIRNAIEPHVANWQLIKQKNLLNWLDHARNERRLAMGIDEVWTETMHKKGKLLVVEKNFMVPAKLVNADHIETGSIIPSNLFHKDAVDDVIEKILVWSGDVEFVEDGVLDAYNHIALIMHY